MEILTSGFCNYKLKVRLIKGVIRSVQHKKERFGRGRGIAHPDGCIGWHIGNVSTNNSPVVARTEVYCLVTCIRSTIYLPVT